MRTLYLAAALLLVAATYSSPAPMERYSYASVQDEIAVARSAAPASISADAGVYVLGRKGFEEAAKSKNGFVCFVERSWFANFDDPEFWNPKLRSPNCFNAAAARSVLPQFLARTQWVLAGQGREQMVQRARAEFAAHHFTGPEPGAMTFMLSKRGYVSDSAAGPWLPHLMFFVPHGQSALYGAGLPGSPIFGPRSNEYEPTIVLVPVRFWSDGSPAPMPHDKEHHHS